MNVTPLDMQVIIPKATEVGRVQQQRDHQDVVQQQQSAAQFQQEAAHKLRQVQNAEKSEGQKIKKDSQKKQQQDSSDGQNRREQAPETEQSVMAVDAIRGRHIDLKM